MAKGSSRRQSCTPEQARTRLRQAEAFVDVAELVVDDVDQVASPGVAAALAVLAGIAASDAACCARLRERPRGQDHLEAVALVSTVHPHGQEMAADLRRLLQRKDNVHYGLTVVSPMDAVKMVGWARRIVSRAHAVVASV